MVVVCTLPMLPLSAHCVAQITLLAVYVTHSCSSWVVARETHVGVYVRLPEQAVSAIAAVGDIHLSASNFNLLYLVGVGGMCAAFPTQYLRT